MSAAGETAIRQAMRVLSHFDQITLDPDLLDSAARLGSANLRSLDVIHLAAASMFQPDLRAVVTYDTRMGAGATALGMAVEAPK